MHAYDDGCWNWERIIQKIRRDTTADIMIRSGRLLQAERKNQLAAKIQNRSCLRRLAHKYGCEIVEMPPGMDRDARMSKMSPEELRNGRRTSNRQGLPC